MNKVLVYLITYDGSSYYESDVNALPQYIKEDGYSITLCYISKAKYEALEEFKGF